MERYFGFAQELLEKGLAVAADPYDTHDLYDLVNQFSYDVNFYCDLAEQAGGKVLDIGCGSGRVLQHLAARGIDAVGLDLSAEMLAAARRKLGSDGDSVELIQADMRDFELPNKFNLIMIPYCSLIYMQDDDERQAVFERCFSHLNPGGTLVFDFLAGEVQSGESLPSLGLQGIHPFTDDILLSVVQIKGLTPALRLLNQVNYQISGQSIKITVQHSVESIVQPEQITELLQETGFVVRGVYNDYRLQPYNGGESCLVIADRPL